MMALCDGSLSRAAQLYLDLDGQEYDGHVELHTTTGREYAITDYRGPVRLDVQPGTPR